MHSNLSYSDWHDELAIITPDHIERINRRYRIKNFTYKKDAFSVRMQEAELLDQISWCIQLTVGLNKVLVWLNPESLRPLMGATAQSIESIYSHPIYIEMLLGEILIQLGMQASLVEKFSSPVLKNPKSLLPKFEKEKPELLTVIVSFETSELLQFYIAADQNWIDQNLMFGQQHDLQKVTQLSDIQIILDTFTLSQEEFHAIESDDVIQTNLTLLKKVDHCRLMENILLTDIFTRPSEQWIYRINHQYWHNQSGVWHELLDHSQVAELENTMTMRMVLHVSPNNLSMLAKDTMNQITDFKISLETVFQNKKIILPAKLCGYQNCAVLKIN
ncbi:MAG: hypothetical protein V4629_07285 [Pseudomonadota bacterium]